MANQPKKYKKFVATAATATLVASAIVPVASAAGFSDVAENNSHAEAINALVEAGIIKGFEDGTFGPNKELTRGHVVKMLGKWVEAQGFEIPADYATVQRFDDVAVDAADQELVKYAALVKDTGVFVGSEGDLNAAGSISRENMALTLDRAYKAVFDKSLVELAAGSTNKTVSDLALAKEEAREEIQALRNLGISNVDTFNPKSTVTRGQFASFLNRTIEAEGTPSTEVGAIKSATATAVNQVTVVFDGAVDTEAAKFAFARGTSAITVSDVDWSEDKTTAVLTVDTKFVDATYTLTVSGVATEDLTASVTATKEVVTSIEFNSDYLVLTGKEDATKGKEAKIGFTIYNQYGEDITEDTNHNNFEEPKINGIDETEIYFDDSKGGREGLITVWIDEREDDDATGTISLTYEDGDIEIDVEHDVTLSDESEPGSVEILNVYNEDDEEFTTENVKDEHKFYVLFNVTDQYGVELDPEDYYADRESTEDTAGINYIRDGLRIDTSNDDIFEIEDEDDITVLKIDGEYFFAVELTFDREDVVGGENTITFRSKATGEENSATINLVGSSEVYKIELSSPDGVVAGDEEVKLPISVYDQNGELLTDAADLNDKLRGTEPEIKITWDKDLVKNSDSQTSAFTFVEEDGQLYLVFETESHHNDEEAEELEIEIEVDDSGEESSVEINVEADAYAESLVDIKGDTYVYDGHYIELDYNDFVVEDQYGRVYDKKDYTIEVLSNDVRKIGAVIGSTEQPDNETSIVYTGANKIKIYGKDGSATVDFKLVSNYWEKDTPAERPLVNESKDSVTFRTVDEDDFESYVVYSDEKLYGTTEDVATVDVANIEVYGVTSNGTEVELSPGAYQVLAGDYLERVGNDVQAGDDAQAELDEPGVSTVKTGVVVVINEDGTRITHEITLADESPKVAALELEDQDSASNELLTSFDLYLLEAGSDDVFSAKEIVDALLEEGNFDIEDQYGEDADYNATSVAVDFFDGSSEELLLTVSDVNDANEDYTLRKNGTNIIEIPLEGADDLAEGKGIEAGDSFTLTLTVDGVTQTIKVYVKEDIAE